ncbi:replication regulatory protein RepA [Pseudocitrobacter faecalis]
MTASEKQLAAVARKRITHKEVKVFIRNPLKDRMIALCDQEGITQAQFIEKLIERELNEHGLLK